MASGPCQLCGRDTALTRHHLVPQSRHGKTRWNRDRYSREQLKHDLILLLCSACHRQIHATLSEKELERDYPTPERLRDHPELARFVAWIRTKPPGFRPPVSQSHRRRRAGRTVMAAN